MTPSPEPTAAPLLFRSLRSSDVAALVKYANDDDIWQNLSDRFPHPYRDSDAEAWIATSQANLGQPLNFAIEHGGELIGCVGLEPRRADDHALIGFWLGRPFWGRGFASEAAHFIAAYAFDRFPFPELRAHVYAWNPASARVLEKAGFSLRERRPGAAVRGDRVGDLLIYVRSR